MKKIITVICCLISCGLATAQTTYSLDQLKQLAIENNYSLRSARNAIQQAKEQQSEAFTKFFPTVSAMGAGMATNKPLIELNLTPLTTLIPAAAGLPLDIELFKHGVYGSVSAVQPVFMGGQIINGNKLAKVGLEASQIQMEQSEDVVEMTTEQYYWQIVSYSSKLSTLHSIHKMLMELEKDVTVMVRVGVVNRNDLLQVQLRKAEIESSSLEVENALTTLRQLLAQYIGKADENVNVVIPDGFLCNDSTTIPAAIPNLPIDLRQDHLAALTSTHQYRLMEKNVESNKIQHKMKIGQNLPSVGVGASYSYNNFLEHGRSMGMVFAAVKVPISGWWGGSHAIKKQQLALNDAQELLKDNSQKLIINMNNAWTNVETSHKKLKIAYDAIAQAEENLRLNSNYYHAGTTKMSDLLQAQEQYQRAYERYTDAFATYQTKLLEYRQATGQ